MQIPHYPEWTPLERSVEAPLSARLDRLSDGISEFTFPGLYLFREHYTYRVSRSDDDHLLLAGEREDGSFFSVPEGLPHDDALIVELFDVFDYLKNLPPSWVDSARERFVGLGFEILPDRANFDYLYRSNELAQLPGKRFHKKRNHVNSFLKEYDHRVEPLNDGNAEDARSILEEWRAGRDDEADYPESLEALELRRDFGLDGVVVYVDEKPVAYAMGEPIGRSETFIVHIEKALPEYRGLYQFVNKAFAERISGTYSFINREQDLGDPGLRQAKMTYRPCGFVEKHRIVPKVRSRLFPEIPSEAKEVTGCGEEA